MRNELENGDGAATYRVDTECHCCHKAFRLDISPDLSRIEASGGAQPVLFVPMVNFKKLREPSIIDRF